MSSVQIFAEDLAAAENTAIQTSNNPALQINLASFLRQISSEIESDADLYSAPVATAMFGGRTEFASAVVHLFNHLGLIDDLSGNQIQDLRDNFLTSLNSAEQPVNYWTWLASQLISPESNDDEHYPDGTSLVLKILDDPNASKTTFHAWSWGYLVTYYASHSLEQYNQYKEKMLAASDEIAEQPSDLGDVLWARVVDLQAAAIAHDWDTYSLILNHMKRDAKQKTDLAALESIPSNEYRAWAISLTRLAAATIGDNKTYNYLESPLQTCMQTSKDKTDKVLAWFINVLSEATYTSAIA